MLAGHLHTPTAIAAPARRWLDRGEQVLVLVLYAWFVVRLWPDTFSAKSFFTVLLFLSEGMVCAFLVIRKSTSQISTDVSDWLVALAGTCLSLIIDQGGKPVSLLLGGLLVLLGMLLQISAKLSLRRSFGIVAANRGVKNSGAYALIRHPMYAGYILSHIGMLLIRPSVWNVTVYAAAWTMHFIRIGREERVLGNDPLYQDYAKQVRYRMVPGVF